MIEDWLPVKELGIESRRESAPIPGQFPKLKTLHVWWARRPLAACAGVILGSVMPAWSKELAAAFPKDKELKTEKSYREWFLRLCGILGDPIAAKAKALKNKELGIKTPENPYDYRPAFKNSPGIQDLSLLHQLVVHVWGAEPTVLDPTAGGGSIPFESIRYGFPTIANDLNSVAAAVLRAGIEVPAKYGMSLHAELGKWGKVLVDRVVSRLRPFFPAGSGEEVLNYIFARTVKCPRTGKTVPLSPNWWLSKEKGGVAVRLITERKGRPLDEVEYEIVSPVPKSYDPDSGTVSGGDAVSPWDHLAIDGNHIKAEAQAGRMGSQLYAVAVRICGKRGFRSPTETDLKAIGAAQREVRRCLDGWLASGVVPCDEVPTGNDKRLHQYGMDHWWKMFSPRQLLVHGIFVEEFQRLVSDVRDELGEARGSAVLALLGMMQGKAINFNSMRASWHASRGTMRSAFERHDFAFKWSYAEFEGAKELYPWCLNQLLEAYEELSGLIAPVADRMFKGTDRPKVPGVAKVLKRNAGDLRCLEDSSQTLVCIDPPYYDNVMYGELSDYFLAWEQHTVGLVWPDLLEGGLSDKENEAVANVARFADAGKRRKELANADYEAKMTAIFSECSRVLRDDGLLAVMFTHKRAEAWDTLGMGLLQSGFSIETSWPVNTESEQALNQARVNAASSTIMLVCRKRLGRHGTQLYFEEIEGEVRQAAREAMLRFSEAGLSGVDLLLSTYGPALSVISSRWPVYSSEADPETGRSRLLRPEEALDTARAEVVRLQKQRLVGHAAQLDPYTDFALIAWDTFRAAEFPYDEARRLALATGGLDTDELERAKILEMKSGTVVLQPPEKRRRRKSKGEESLPGVRPDASSFPVALDAVHTVMYVAEVDGMAAAKALIDRAGLSRDARFLATLQGLVRAIPRTKIKGKWVRDEARILDAICAARFKDIEIPADTAPQGVQGKLFSEEE